MRTGLSGVQAELRFSVARGTPSAKTGTETMKQSKSRVPDCGSGNNMGVTVIQLLRPSHLLTVTAKLVCSLTLSSKVSRAEPDNITLVDSAWQCFVFGTDGEWTQYTILYYIGNIVDGNIVDWNLTSKNDEPQNLLKRLPHFQQFWPTRR